MTPASPTIEPSAASTLRLAMIGDGPLRDEVARVLAAAGVEHLAWLPGARNDVPALMRAFDWESVGLPPADGWPLSLKAVTRILLTSRYAMWMGWGPELRFTYNDAYAAMSLGESVYLGSGEAKKTQQIVLSGTTGPDGATIRWAIRRESRLAPRT